MNQFWGVDADPTAQGRIKGAKPVAVLDIGSNSVRLVVYERHARSLTPLYNEKASCALGRGIAATGKLSEENVERALSAIQRFALVARLMRVGKLHVLATSATREASNGPAFVEAVEAIIGTQVRVLSGTEEAHFAALGVVAGIPDFGGIVGDLGGGSLELSRITEGLDTEGESYELGVIRLQDDSAGSPVKAAAAVRERLQHAAMVRRSGGQAFCAIGGTWRSLAKLHQSITAYPLHMVQDYVVKAEDMRTLTGEIVAAASVGKVYPGSEHVSSSRRDLVPYGAAVLGEVLRLGSFETVVFSALGVREGYLYGMLDRREQTVDPLVQAAEEISVLRSRSPAHAYDLIEFTGGFLQALGIEETPAEKRLREVACLISDIGWRGHPDYRGQQSIDIVAYSSITGIDHPGRAFLAEVLAVRYNGLKHKDANPEFLGLAIGPDKARARLIGALFRVGYPMSAAMPGVLPRTRFATAGTVLQLILPDDLAFLGEDHLRGRLEQLSSLAGFKQSRVVTESLAG